MYKHLIWVGGGGELLQHPNPKSNFIFGDKDLYCLIKAYSVCVSVCKDPITLNNNAMHWRAHITQKNQGNILFIMLNCYNDIILYYWRW